MAIFKTVNSAGKYLDICARHSVINYILKPEKIVEGYFGMWMVDEDNPAKSMDDVAAYYNKSNGVKLRHFIIGFDREELSNPKIADNIGREIMYRIGNAFQCVYAVHQDTDNLNLHIVFNAVSYNTGKRFRGTYKEFFALQKMFQNVLCKFGIYRLYYVSNNN